MTTRSDEIKRLVRERYGARAKGVIELAQVADETTDAACCSPSDVDRALRLYNEGQLAGLPAESIAASAGCGNPTALAGLRPGERVLDLGSGGGIDCFLASQQVGSEGHVTGLDMTDDMLALARANQAKLGIDNVKFVKGEMENMPLPDASMDVVISNCVVCLSPDKDAVFQEAFPGSGRWRTCPTSPICCPSPKRALPGPTRRLGHRALPGQKAAMCTWAAWRAQGSLTLP